MSAGRLYSHREKGADMMEDIITALATAWGEGGIAVVRLSGEGSVELADRLYRGNKKLANMPPRYLDRKSVV